MQRLSDRKAFFVIISLSLIFKLWVFFDVSLYHPSRFFQPDSTSYIKPAISILKHGNFASDPDKPYHPETIRTPGYPVFLAVIFKIFGNRMRVVIIIQILLGLVLVLLTYLIGKGFLSREGTLYASFLVAFDPSLASMQLLVLSECLFSVLLSFAVFLLLKIIKNPFESEIYLFTGCVFALATLVKPALYYLFPIMFLYFLFFQIRKDMGYKSILYQSFLFVIPFLVFVGGWQIRNYVRAGDFELSRITGINLLFYNAAGVVAEKEGIPFKQAQNKLGYLDYRKIHSEAGNLSDMELSTRFKREGMQIILNNPYIYFKVHLRGMYNFLVSTGVSSLFVLLQKYQHGRILASFRKMNLINFAKFIFSTGWIVFLITFLNLVWLFVMYVPVLFSFLFKKGCNFKIGEKEKDRTWIISFLVFVGVYFCVISGGPPGGARLKSPIIPLIALLSGYGIQCLIGKINGKRKTMKLISSI